MEGLVPDGQKSSNYKWAEPKNNYVGIGDEQMYYNKQFVHHCKYYTNIL